MSGISMNSELLISEIQKREVLWNKKCKEYKNRFLVEVAWEEVSTAMNMSKEEVKAKWKNLRDNFNKELKKIPVLRSGDGGEEDVLEYHGKWQHFVQMLFLKDIQIPRRTEGNFTESLETQETTEPQPVQELESPLGNLTQEEVYEYLDAEDPVLLTTVTDVPQGNCNRITSTCAARQPPPKKQKILPFEERLLQMEEEKLKVLGSSVRNQDEDTHFLDSILPYFKKLGDLQKLRVRNEFQAILIRELSRNED